VRTSVRLPLSHGKRTEVRTPAGLREPDSSAVTSRLDGLLADRLATTLGPPLVALALALGYGQLALSRARNHYNPRLRVAAIQDHIKEETTSLLPVAARETEEPDQEALTRRAVTQGAKLVVWSESCLGTAFDPRSSEDPTVSLARELRAHLVVGYVDGARPRPFNCAGLLAPDGALKGVHHKLHPFLGERQAVQRGRGARAFSTDLGRIGMEICFDSCYTEPTRRLTADGARLIAMPNYDPPTPGGILHHLHAAVLPFRAVENRVPFVRADPNGFSQIVDATGRIVAESRLFVADALVADVPLGDGRGTPFTRLGDWLAYGCLLGMLTVALTVLRSRRSDQPRGDLETPPS
jgi:apolipoprotein N-acyltransferase